MSTPTEPDRARLLADCLEAHASGDPGAIDRACERHPELAEEIRAIARSMDDLRSVVEGGERADREPSDRPRIDGFELLQRMGRGGMGEVWAARDRNLDRIVAIKVLAGRCVSEASLERFRREARSLAQIRHPRVVAVLQAGLTADQQPYYAMERIAGESLRAVLQRIADRQPVDLRAADLRPANYRADTKRAVRPEPSYVEAAVRMFREIAEGLEQAHALDIVHRDVKPANILLDEAGEPKLVDFGIAWMADEATLTHPGAVLGTPAYMAPEQIPGGDGGIGPQTDVFALGVVLYQVLTLRAPFGGTTTAELFRATLRRDPQRLTQLNPMIPRDLETICLEALDKSPARRYPTAGALAEDLGRLLEMRAIEARPVGPAQRVLRRIRSDRRLGTVAVLVLLAVPLLLAGSLLWGAADARDARRAAIEAARAWKGEREALERRQRVHADRAQRMRLGYMSDSEVWDLSEASLKLRDSCTRVLESNRTVLGCIDRALQFFPRDAALRRLQKYVEGEGYRLAFSQAPQLPTDSNAGDGRVVVLRGVAPDVEVHVFRYELLTRLRPDAEHRLVPVPCADAGDARRAAAPSDLVGRTLLVVDAVRPGSAGAAAGLVPGDLISAFAGRAVEDRVFVLSPPPEPPTPGPRAQLFDPVELVGDVAVRSPYELEHAYNETRIGGAIGLMVCRGRRRLQCGLTRKDDLSTDLGFVVGYPEEVLNTEVPAPGCEVEVRSSGIRRLVHLEGETGLTVRRTACPLILSGHSLLGAGPRRFAVAPGSYLFVFRAPGRELQRLPVLVEPDDSGLGQSLTVEVELPGAGTTPPGFVHVPAGSTIRGGDPVAERSRPRECVRMSGFWISRTEVTLGQYEEFLADRENLESVEAGDPAGLVPRIHPSHGVALGPIWGKGPDGRYHPLPFRGNPPRRDWPVFGVTWRAAVEFAKWLTRKRDDGFVYGLPRSEQWECAARGADGRLFPWGDFLHPHNFNWARARQGEKRPEPVLRFHKDESPYGVRNMSGGVLEWCSDAGATRDSRIWCGSAFLDDDPSHSRCSTKLDGAMDRPGPNDGFRLVATRLKGR